MSEPPSDSEHRPAAARSKGAAQTPLTMKQRLGELVNAYMRCASKDAAPVAVQHDLSELAHAFTLEPNRVYRNDEYPRSDNYGFQLSFEVKAAPAAGVLGIVADFPIHCGGDAGLCVFAQAAGAWREVLRWQAKEYKTVAGAFGSFEYVISPTDRTRRW